MRTYPKKRDIDLPSWLAYLYKPILPYLKHITIKRERTRKHNPRDILLPEGYRAEVVATGFNAPVHCCFDDQGFCYVSECGHKIDSVPRILKVDVHTGDTQVFFELPEQEWALTGALTGACWHAGALYVTNTNTLFRLHPDKTIEPIITDLPSRGDHQTNYPVIGPDDKLYFGVGSVTNSGVVGADNFAYEWLPRFPETCDVPAHDLKLAGRNYAYKNVLGDLTETVHTGAYVPFGTETHPEQIIPGNVKCTGAILRCNPDGTALEVVAWGLRNPYGLAFDPQGRLFATEHGMDDRSKRYIIDDPDDFYAIQDGAWYGWPDFASGIRLDDPVWGSGGQGREPVLAEFPDANPPRPLVSFTPHAAANGLDFCRDPAFGFPGDAFVALYGDLTPVTSVRPAGPLGFKVVRIDMHRHTIVDFAVNWIAGPASQLGHGGFERPSHCQFGPDGALYVVDFGEVHLAPERGGLRMPKGTGTLWRILRTQETLSEQPDPSSQVPIYRLAELGLLLILGFLIWLGWRQARTYANRG